MYGRSPKARYLLAACFVVLFWSFPGFAATAPGFRVTRIVSDGIVSARTVVKNLVNPWGIALDPQGRFWLALNGRGLLMAFDAQGHRKSIPILVPSADAASKGTPTGIIVNGTKRFVIKSDTRHAPAQFLIASEDGAISAYNPSVDRSSAIRVIDRSADGAVYKGLATARLGKSDFLYAANFHSGAIDVFDSHFRPVQLRGVFHDETVPDTFSPSNIANIGGKLYVSYAIHDAAGVDAVPGKGNGIIDVFNPDGTLSRRLVSSGPLNAPWGMAANDGAFGNLGRSLLVANSGDGRINAFDLKTGAFVSTLTDSRGRAIVENGLWGLAFSDDRLFFTAGLARETMVSSARFHPPRPRPQQFPSLRPPSPNPPPSFSQGRC